MASVELRRVSKVYPGPVTVLDDIDLHVSDGELLVVLGENGSGKTTLLRLIAGLECPTSGEIRIGGHEVSRWTPRQRDVAMVFQSGVLYPHWNVQRNLRAGLSGSGGVIERLWSRLTNRAMATASHDRRSDAPGNSTDWSADADASRPADEAGFLEDRVRDTAQLLGIESMLNRLPRQLSGGERQRVALGRALVRRPAVFLLDEPLANADMKLRQELRLAFRTARRQTPGTMILVTHDHTEALALGERIAVLSGGKVQQVGSAEEVWLRPRNRLVAEFLGQSRMSFVEGQVQADAGRAWFESKLGGWQLPWDVVPAAAKAGRKVSVGWRPVAARVVPASEAVGSAGVGSEMIGPATNLMGIVEWLEFGEEGSTVYVRMIGQATQEECVVAGRASPDNAMSSGERVRVEVNWSRALWFDAETGNNLTENTLTENNRTKNNLAVTQ